MATATRCPIMVEQNCEIVQLEKSDVAVKIQPLQGLNNLNACNSSEASCGNETRENSDNDLQNYLIRATHQYNNGFVQEGPVPSESYEIFGSIGICLLVLDMITDVVCGILNMICGRFIQGILSLLIVIFPVLQHLTSGTYKNQKSLIKFKETSLHISNMCCGYSLSSRLFDPVIWAYNHHIQTIEYRQDLMNPDKRLKFYFTKQMAQLSLKNEAQMESSYQLALTFCGLLYFFDTYVLSERILIIASIVFSGISMARAACGDLAKTKCNFYSITYPLQTTYWKLLRVAAVFNIIIATLISNGTWIMYWHKLFFEDHTIPLGLDMFLGCLTALFINCFFQAFWCLVNDSQFFRQDFNCCGKRTFAEVFQTYFHFVVRSGLINIYRSASLYNYSLGQCRHFVLLVINFMSLIVLFVPFVMIDSALEQYAVVIMKYTFVVCLILGLITSVLVRHITNPIILTGKKMHKDILEYTEGSRLYQLP